MRNGDYYSFINAGNTNYALSFSSTSVGVGSYSASSDSYKWQPTFLGMNVPLIKQSHNNYCGVASTLQILYALDSSQIDRTSDDLKDQMDALAPSIMVGAVGDRSEMLKILQVENTKYRVHDNKTPEAIYSIQSGYPCIAHVKPTQLFPRYIEYGVTYEGGHFITVIGYDSVSGYLVFSDCSYVTSGSRTNFGIYLVDCADLDSSGSIDAYIASH